MLSRFKISRNLFSSNLNSLYLCQKQLLKSSSNNNNNNNEPETEKKIDEADNNKANRESDSSQSQSNIDDILGLFSSSSTTQGPSLSQDREGIGHFLSNFQSNKPKKSFSSSLPTSSSSRSSPNSEIAKLLSDFLVPSEENYILHIHASYNNTLVTLTNSRGDVLITKSGGSVGFKKSQRGGYEAAHQAAVSVVQKVKEKGLNVKNVEICIKGFGPGRDAAFKALANVENQWNVKRITDTTPLPFNGCRPRKARRL